MAFREVRVDEAAEVLRLRLDAKGHADRVRCAWTERASSVSSAAAAEADLDRGTAQPARDDELMAKGMRAARPHRRPGQGEPWSVRQAHHDQLKAWLIDNGLTAVQG